MVITVLFLSTISLCSITGSKNISDFYKIITIFDLLTWMILDTVHKILIRVTYFSTKSTHSFLEI